jgi:hypothetical protein
MLHTLELLDSVVDLDRSREWTNVQRAKGMRPRHQFGIEGEGENANGSRWSHCVDTSSASFLILLAIQFLQNNPV